MEDKEKRVAVLIDAENVSSKYIEIILNEAISLGNIIIKRIYGDWTNLAMSSWISRGVRLVFLKRVLANSFMTCAEMTPSLFKSASFTRRAARRCFAGSWLSDA